MNRMFLVIGIVLLLGVACLQACTLTHSITVPCDVDKLIQAIYSANTNPALTNIHLDPGCVYILTDAEISVEDYFGGSTFNYGDVGLPPITSLVVINGRNATITRAVDAPDFRIFHVTETGSLTLNDLTITNGLADSSMPDGTSSAFPGSGGAIYNDGGLLTVNESVLESNNADFHGGAIFMMNSGTTTITDSTISDNTAPLGGGIYIYHGGLLSISGTSILRNNALTEGGGINVGHGARLVISSSLISFNHSVRRGGGIFKDGGSSAEPTTISGSTFEGNTADWGGGAVFVWRTPLLIGTTTFLRNQADGYGGGLVFQSSGDDTINVRSCTFEGNQAGLDGGGLHFSGKMMSILNTTFFHNTAQNGGAVHMAEITEPTYISRSDSSMIVRMSSFKENSVDFDGGGIYNEGSLSVETGEFSGNSAGASGGGIANHGKIVVQDNSFLNNEAKESGGGITSTGTTAVIRSTFAYNSAIRGGGLAVPEGVTVLQNDTFSENVAKDMGGGISVNSSGSVIGDVQASFITVAYNKAVRGGGIAVVGGKMKVKNSLIAYSYDGGDCSTSGGTFSAVADNMDSDATCLGYTLSMDPVLDVLANYGGTTETHALKMDSPAIDAVTDCTNLYGAAVALDQRSFSRPVGPFCDLGAFEYQQLLPAPSIVTSTPTLTLTPTSTPEKATPTPDPPSVTAIKNANCRYGPGMLYEIADTLMQGQSALVIGRNEENTWWQIVGPRNGVLCWVAHTTVEETGPVEGAPIGIAPAEPTLTSKPLNGCYVYDAAGAKKCVVPCPANAQQGGPCSP